MQLVDSGAKLKMPKWKKKKSQLVALIYPWLMWKGLGGKQITASNTPAPHTGENHPCFNFRERSYGTNVWARSKYTTSQSAISPCLQFFLWRPCHWGSWHWRLSAFLHSRWAGSSRATCRDTRSDLCSWGSNWNKEHSVRKQHQHVQGESAGQAWAIEGPACRAALSRHLGTRLWNASCAKTTGPVCLNCLYKQRDVWAAPPSFCKSGTLVVVAGREWGRD